MAFYLIWHDGRDLTGLPYAERRAALEALDLNGDCWRTPGWRRGEGTALLEAAKAQALEGVMAKRLTSPYCPGRRTQHWLKIKAKMSQELVVGGWQPGDGRREGTVGSLLMGHYEDGRLQFAGKVGTGFSDRELDRLAALFATLTTEECPFDPPPPRLIARSAHWLEPSLVAEVEFAEWTSDGSLRHPTYLGTRDDKDPRAVVREP
jgi:bifunctional non-homologous end joining protein LigD